MIFEFGRGDVVFVAPTGRVEVRFVAVDRKTGEVGTRNEAAFHTRYTALAARCEEQIRGTSELFPFTPTCSSEVRGLKYEDDKPQEETPLAERGACIGEVRNRSHSVGLW